MSEIIIKRVETRKDLQRFIEFHYDLYKGNEYDAPVLFSDDMKTLSRDKNRLFPRLQGREVGWTGCRHHQPQCQQEVGPSSGEVRLD